MEPLKYISRNDMKLCCFKLPLCTLFSSVKKDMCVHKNAIDVKFAYTFIEIMHFFYKQTYVIHHIYSNVNNIEQ